MTITIPQVDEDTDNWQDFWEKFNQAANAMSTSVVTVNSNTTIGNAVIGGSIRANVVFADVISGGIVGVPAALNFSSNVAFFANVSYLGSNNSLGAIGNTHVVGANATHQMVMANNTTGKLRMGSLNAEIQLIDGPGSLLDADLLDGQQGAYYANVVARLGYTPANKAGDTLTGPMIGPNFTANTMAANIVYVSQALALANSQMVVSGSIGVSTNTSPIEINVLSTATKMIVSRTLGNLSSNVAPQATTSEVLAMAVPSGNIAAGPSDVLVTEYSVLNSGANNIGTFTANVSGGFGRLYLTPDPATSAINPFAYRIVTTAL